MTGEADTEGTSTALVVVVDAAAATAAVAAAAAAATVVVRFFRATRAPRDILGRKGDDPGVSAARERSAVGVRAAVEGDQTGSVDVGACVRRGRFRCGSAVECGAGLTVGDVGI